jgi:ligand-binding sensor domain-containing protein
MIVLIIVLVFASPAIAQIQAISQGTDDSLWIARADHLLKIRMKPEVVTWYRGSGAVRTILADPNGNNLWIGSEEGLFRCDIPAETCEIDSRIPPAAILAISHAGDSLSVATAAKIYKIKGQTVTSAALPSNRVATIAVSKTGVIWIGTGSSVQTFRDGSFQEVLKSSAQAIMIEPATGVVWIGAGQELVRYENGNTESFPLPPPPANVRMRPPITSILATRAGKVLVGTHGGLLQLSGKTFQEILDEEVLTLLEDKKGTVWIGTAEGLKKMINGKFSDVPLPE